MQIFLLTKRKIGNWHIYGQAYHLMLKTPMVYLNLSAKNWQLAAIPKICKFTLSKFANFSDFARAWKLPVQMGSLLWEHRQLADVWMWLNGPRGCVARLWHLHRRSTLWSCPGCGWANFSWNLTWWWMCGVRQKRLSFVNVVRQFNVSWKWNIEHML